MISDIYNRPMFQTPERRAGGGIMAGVAPINQFMGPMRLEDGGDPGLTEYAALAPNVFSDMMENVKLSDDFFSTEKTEAGSGINFRDITDFLIVDPSDPVDIAIALATAPLLIYPPAAIAANLARQGYKASKIDKVVDKAKAIQESPSVTDRLKTAGIGYGIMGGARSVPGISESLVNLVSEEPKDSEDQSGGIAKIATSIAEARDMKVPTFTRNDKELAAVTVEDVEQSGLGSLQNYLNEMDFDEDLGEYIKKVEDKSGGGIMKLNRGGKVIDFFSDFFKRLEDAVKNKNIDEIKNLKKESSSTDLNAVQRSTVDGELKNAEIKLKEEGLDIDLDAPPSRPVEPVSSTAAGSGSKIINYARENPLKTAAAVGGAGTLGYMYGTTDPEKQDEVITSSGEPSEQPGDDTTDTGKDSGQGFFANTRDFIGNTLGKLVPGELKNLYASDPRKAMFIAGQLMKAREGVVPINTLTALTEAEAAYENMRLEEESKKAPIMQTANALIDKLEELSNPLEPENQEALVLTLFEAAQGDARLKSLIDAIDDAPELLKNPQFIDTITQELIKTTPKITEIVAGNRV